MPADRAAHERASKWLRWWCWFVAAESAVFVGVYVYGGWFAESSFPFVTNSAAKDLLFALLAALAATAPRRHSAALALVLYGHVTIVALNLIEALFTGPPRDAGTFDPAALDAGTLIETAQDVERALALTDVGWCLDTGHLLIGGVEPADFVREQAARIVHVHLKDVDAALAQRFRSGELSLVAATQHGLFRPLGQGDAGIAEVTALLDANGYEGWLVLEQDTAITGMEPPVGSGPIVDVQACIDFLTKPAPPRERVIGS